MKIRPNHGFILAAGKGTRLRPYTDYLPKPLVEVAGQSLIDHALDHMESASVGHVTVNLHYMADMLENHLLQRARPLINISREADLLDTGGGIKKALHMVGDAAFYVVSGDSLWTDGEGQTALDRMADEWDPEIMDMLLLLQPVSQMKLTQGVGDYDLQPDGQAVRSLDKVGGYMWTSVRIVKPALFDGTPSGPFSFLDLMDRAEKTGRLYGLVHDADWYHISTAEDLERVNASFKGQKRYA